MVFRYRCASIARMESIGTRIRRLRKNAKLSQEKLAETIGVGQGMLSTYELDQVVFGADILEKLASGLHTTMDYIAMGERATAARLERAFFCAQHSYSLLLAHSQSKQFRGQYRESDCSNISFNRY